MRGFWENFKIDFGGFDGGRPNREIYLIQTRLRSVGSVADTKLNCAAKGATLLQLISLSADASQGSS